MGRPNGCDNGQFNANLSSDQFNSREFNSRDQFNAPPSDLFLQANSFGMSRERDFGLMNNCQLDGRRSSAYDPLEPVTVKNKDGSEIVVDEFNRVTRMRDAANRNFEFKYDRKSGEISGLTNEDGVWERQKKHGSFTDEWKSKDGGKWHGTVEVDEKGYSFRDDNQRTIYRPKGIKSVEHLGSDDRVISRFSEDKMGNTASEDYRSGIIKFNGPDGRSAIQDLKEKSFITFDRDGHMTNMRDARGQKFAFADFDDRGQPQTVTNGQGVWKKQGEDRWVNQKDHKSWYGKVEVDPQGSYTYTDLSGKKVSHGKDGTTTTYDKGVTTVIDKAGKQISTFADGQIMKEGASSHISFKVEKGETKSAEIKVAGADVDIVQTKNGEHAQIRTKADTAVKAMQDGRVVYSFNHGDSNNPHGKPDIQLTPQDLAVIEQYKKTNPNEDLVVMQCYDKKAQGVRYEIYAGLGLASARTGDTIKAGEVIGRSSEDGYAFAARRQRVAGKAVHLTSK